MKKLSAVAPLSTYLFFISGVTVALPLFLLVLYVFLCETHPLLIVPAAGATLLVAGVYFWAPVAYEIDGSTLTVRSRLGSRIFRHVVRYYPCPRGRMPGGSPWFNFGIFGIRGLYWSRMLRWYRAYVTNPRYLVIVELESGKKLAISPEDAPCWDSKTDFAADDSFITNLPIDAAFAENLQILNREKPLY